MVDKLGESMDECDVLLKNHEAFERLIGSQEEKVRFSILATLSFTCR